MSKDKMTPEDKLLRIIEDPSAGKDKSFGIFKKKFSESKSMLSSVSLPSSGNISQLLKLRTINKLLAGGCVLVTVFLVAYFYYLKGNTDKRLVASEIISSDFSIMKESKAYLKVSLDEGMSSARKRNIFSFIPPKDDAKGKSGEDLTEGDIYRLLEGLKLVGIIWSETHPEVMVEDTNEEKTHLLSVGDRLGFMEIKKIYRNKVVIEVEGSEMELR
ncbi:MAG: hypothetical protein ABIH71_06890 [Candidatus Omnitrophota bacterium]|nr:hypothetical protein [Candidatus Omnitrophota bacterium]